MEPPVGGPSQREDAAYRAGVLDARLRTLEQHSVLVNGSIEKTGRALVDLTLVVNEVRLTLKLLEITELTQRVSALEKTGNENTAVDKYRRWLVGAAITLALGVGGFAVAAVLQYTTR